MILTVDEARAYVSSSLTDDALLELLTATETDITAAAGPVGAQTEYHWGGYATLVLDRTAGTVGAVVEDTDGSPLTLDATDYRVEGMVLRRLMTGTNPGSWWRGRVSVAHTPATSDVDIAARIRAQVALLQLEISAATGVSSERVGDYSVSYGMNTRGPTYGEQRAAILAGLRPVMIR